MTCSCGAAAIYRVIITTPSDLAKAPANERGKSWVVFFCEKCIPIGRSEGKPL